MRYDPVKVGDRFGSVKVLGLAFRKGTKTHWLVECKCGRRPAIRQDVLRKVKSCGCESSPTFTKQTQKRFRLVRELLRKHPKFSTCGLARMLHRDYPHLYRSVGSANSVIRQIRGANGNQSNRDMEFRR